MEYTLTIGNVSIPLATTSQKGVLTIKGQIDAIKVLENACSIVFDNSSFTHFAYKNNMIVRYAFTYVGLDVLHLSSTDIANALQRNWRNVFYNYYYKALDLLKSDEEFADKVSKVSAICHSTISL